MNGCGSHEHTGQHSEHGGHAPPARRWSLPTTVALVGFLAIAGFFLLEEHWAHMQGALPYLLVVAAMFFCMFGHGHGGHGHRDEGESP